MLHADKAYQLEQFQKLSTEQGMELTDVKTMRGRLQACVQHLILFKISHIFANYPIKKLEKGILCTICFEQKQDYITICTQIQHILCIDCYCNLFKTAETINCPICRGGKFMHETSEYEYSFIPHPINVYRVVDDETGESSQT